MLHARLTAIVLTTTAAAALGGCRPSDGGPACLTGLTLTDATLYAGASEISFEAADHSTLHLKVDHEDASNSGFMDLFATDGDGPADVEETLVGKHFALCRGPDGGLDLRRE